MSDNNPWASSTPLSNQDFKALLATPRPDWQRGGSGAAGAGGETARGAGGAAAKKDKPFKPPKPRPKLKPTAADGDDDEPKYRDRADERRKGVNADYEDAEADLLARGIRPDGLNQLTIEESKFLGGDAAHTHLVKGLDYALLQQERLKQQQQQQHPPGAPGAAGGGDERRREQKLDGQLGKIKQIFKDKGYGDEAAFRKPEKLEVAMTPQRKRTRI